MRVWPWLEKLEDSRLEIFSRHFAESIRPQKLNLRSQFHYKFDSDLRSIDKPLMPKCVFH